MRFRFVLAALALGAPAAQAQTAPPATPPANAVYTYVEQMPQPPGGMSALMQALGQQLQYPSEAAQQRLEGRVFVNFVVNTEGRIEQAKVVKGAHPLLDAEALRVVAQMPAWTPGRQSGRAVNVSYTLPIAFRLPPPAPAAPAPTADRPASKDRPPYPQGGQEALANYLKTAPYPEEARKAQASGVVFIQVEVDAQGQVEKISPAAGIGLQNGQATPIMPALRLEALNLISNGPGWVAGQAQGQPAAGSHIVPLQFDAATGTVSLLPGLRLFPEQPPVIPGGPDTYLRAMAQRVRYPAQAMRQHRQGKVVLFVQVSEDGRLEYPQVIESVSPELDAEALRVAKLLPPMSPALEQGQPVRSYFLLPFTFTIK
ncbi:hypothetical protein GCM10027048_13320 [Hymenobacter coalescens]